MGIKSLVKRALTERENRIYRKELRDKQISYHQWVSALEADAADASNIRDTANTRNEECLFEEEFELFVNPGGHLAEHAKEWIREFFGENPDVLIVYGDEDIWEPDQRERTEPWFKPDWSPDNLYSGFYMGSLVAVRKNWFEHAAKDTWEPDKESWKKAREKEASYQDCVLHCLKMAKGFEKGCRSIGHIPRILYHCDSREDRENYRQYAFEPKGNAAWSQVFQKEETQPSKHAAEDTSVSVIIPSKDHPDMLAQCLEGLRKASGGIGLQIIVVDNGSSGENRKKTQALLDSYPDTVYLYEPMEFHFSRMCNLGAEQAKEEQLLFLNDDVVLDQQDTLRVMTEAAKRDYTGAVGLLLCYPDSERIQHAGVANLPMGPVHKLQFLNNNTCYYFDWNKGRRNVLAVTAACLMVEKRKYQEAGGFAEELRVAFNDVDFCFRLYELGYHNVCLNDRCAFHHESLSRGDDEAPEKLERLLVERKILYDRHPALRGVDPYYPVFLNREELDTHIRLGYETAGNRLQTVRVGEAKKYTQRELSAYREDACLLLRVESALEDGVITGYGVVLGDNNTCYSKELLFLEEHPGEQEKLECSGKLKELEQPEDARSLKENRIYAVVLQNQYRPDLAENMPDQVHVGLCGYRVQICAGALPPGRYRIGMAARNQTCGIRLINWSNRRIEIGTD